MKIVIDTILFVTSLVLALPSAVLALEVGASLLGRRRFRRDALSADSSGPPRPRVGVVVPAHNEQAVLGRTLASLMPQLRPGDRALVVADNCSDDTAAIARAAGALCVEREDRVRRGKGYALEAGVRAFDADPPDVVVFTDADVEVGSGALEALALQAFRTRLPAQGEYLMSAPPRARTVDLVSRFAFTLKNRVRPLGLWRMGLPVPLFGSGMAFPWHSIQDAPLASSDLVEDMRLGIDLCRRGHAPLFCPAARFTGILPADAADAATQRRRWEHGHLNVLMSVPGLLVDGLRRGSLGTVAMALDHLVQPLTVLCGELVVLLAAALSWWLWQGGRLAATATIISGACAAAMFLAMVAAWAVHMRRQIPPRALLGLPKYIFARAANQASWLLRSESDWVRTPRDEERQEAKSPPPPAQDRRPPGSDDDSPPPPAGESQSPPPAAAASSEADHARLVALRN